MKITVPGRHAGAAMLLCAVLVATACGGRLSEAERAQARGLTAEDRSAGPGESALAGGPSEKSDAPSADQAGAGGDSAANATGGTSAAPSAAAAGGTTGGASAPQAAAQPGSGAGRTNAGAASAPASDAGRPAAARAATGPDSTAGAAPVERPGGSTTPQPSTAAAPAPPGGGQAPVPSPSGGPKPSVRIGSITHLSGPAASGTLPALDGLQIWVKYINDKGGLNGHPVELIVADDNTDSARHRQLTQELVEQDGVVAFLQQGEALTGASSVGYNTEKQIPVINSSGGNDYYYDAPTYFPIGAHGKEFVRGSLFNASDQGKVNNVNKYGVLACSEAPICDTTMAVAGNEQNVKAAGMELVYTARVSLVQPDFTAECVQARNAGVDILQIALDGNGVGRVAASCNRQNYHPLISVFGAIAFDKMKDNPDLDGMTTNANSFPYFLCDDPRAKEYCGAYSRFGPAKVYGVGNTNGWQAGKALERAARNLPAPTAQAILAGMWSFKDETLGGLTQPLTFTKGQNAPRQACWWPLVLTEKKWTAPNGMDVKCRS